MRNSVTRLLDIMASLRDPEHGCPWDLQQDFASIVPHTLEEAYEVADAIEQQDWDELRAELGDLLFQIAFYSQLAREKGYFEFHQVVDGICEKMIRRHPHVFADQRYEGEKELRSAWEEHKRQERAARQREHSSQLDGVVLALPALTRSAKLQKRAAGVGFDWPSASGALDKTHEELAEVDAAMAAGDRQHLQEELGDLLFAVVNIIRLSGMDAEQTMRLANQKFEKRFRAMEQQLVGAGHADLGELDLEALEAAWERVKASEEKKA